LLDTEQRREELAQIAGGKSDHEAMAFADSLLAQAANARRNAQTSHAAPTKATKVAAKVAAKSKVSAKSKTVAKPVS